MSIIPCMRKTPKGACEAESTAIRDLFLHLDGSYGIAKPATLLGVENEERPSPPQAPQHARCEVFEQRLGRQAEGFADQEQTPDARVADAELDVGDVVAGDAHRLGQRFLSQRLLAPELRDPAAERLQRLLSFHFAVDCTASLAYNPSMILGKDAKESR